ncbi:hypothetical protein Cgig2_004656 [Carnegiea gigantea]|uniref:Uncharacterized protein n=1 Tax=Carnegiea gigantea TaxID=171969 RepID=A0A9Q1K0E8_9CARY|nr:hypothetical protein Cgig2_004656 [Carnegiea gigantea]
MEVYKQVYRLIAMYDQLCPGELVKQAEAGAHMALKVKRNCHYMDINPQSKEVSLDLARELLIAISQSLPENLTSSKVGKELSNGHDISAVANGHGDGAEELRSELISISYIPSPDKFVLPPMGMEKALHGISPFFTVKGSPCYIAYILQIISHRRLTTAGRVPSTLPEAFSTYLKHIEEIVIASLEEGAAISHPTEFLTEMRKFAFAVILQIMVDKRSTDHFI